MDLFTNLDYPPDWKVLINQCYVESEAYLILLKSIKYYID